ncbi:hypothetical protein SORBI_3001G264550 [Sorghum bicolor]|uniref:Uncharacterized protein n=1 Tax=Sorghum bicolor TaxID=4558 RepID=A0A1Z5S7P5_SORBI|nr:hypothetical protein SORBI_3001G264550 [Sorghum bicolor]
MIGAASDRHDSTVYILRTYSLRDRDGDLEPSSLRDQDGDLEQSACLKIWQVCSCTQLELFFT